MVRHRLSLFRLGGDEGENPFSDDGEDPWANEEASEDDFFGEDDDW